MWKSRLTLIAWTILCTASPAAPEDLVGVPTGTFLLQPWNRYASATIPVNIKTDGLSPDLIHFSIADVRHESTPRDVLLGTFTAHFPEGETGAQRTPILKIKAPIRSLRAPRHGSYLVTLDAVAEQSDGSRLSQSLTLTLDYPETKLVTPEPIFIHETRTFGLPCYWNWIRWACRQSLPSLFLEVDTGPTLRGVTTYQVGSAKIGDEPARGRLFFDTPEKSGWKARVPISIEDPFSLGDSTGSVRIKAPGMETSKVNFTVRSRQGWIPLLFWAGLGLATGFAIRVVVQAKLESAKVRLQLQRFLVQVAKSRNRTDPEYERDLQSIEDKARSKLTEIGTLTAEDRSKIPEDLKGIQQELDQAITASNGRIMKAREELTNLSDIVETAWILPAPLTVVQGGLKTQVDQIEQLLEIRDLPGFDDQLDTTLSESVEKLGTSLGDWGKIFLTSLRSIPKSMGQEVLPKDVAEAQAKSTRQLASKLAEAGSLPADKTQAIKRLFEIGHDSRNLAERLLYEIQEGTYLVASGVLGTLRLELNESNQAEIERAMGALSEFELAPAIHEPSKLSVQFASAILAVIRAMTEAIESLFSGGQALADAQTLIAAGKYEEAAALARQSVAHPPSFQEAADQGMDSAIDRVQRVFLRWHPQKVEEHRTMLQTRPASGPLERLEVEIERTWREILKQQRVQFFVAAAGLAFLSLYIFGSSFVGTFEDATKVFLWGFTTDIGINTLIDKAKIAR